MRTQSSPATSHLAAIAATALVLFAGPPVARAQGRCGAGVDLVVQALEKMRADSGSSELADANQLLKRAAELCGELGDAWYYRYAGGAQTGTRRAGGFCDAPGAEVSLGREQRAGESICAGGAAARGQQPKTVTGPGTAAAGPSDHPVDRWALIIGIGSFTDPNIAPLRYTASERRVFGRAAGSQDWGLQARSRAQPCSTIRRRRRTSRST